MRSHEFIFPASKHASVGIRWAMLGVFGKRGIWEIVVLHQQLHGVQFYCVNYWWSSCDSAPSSALLTALVCTFSNGLYGD